MTKIEPQALIKSKLHNVRMRATRGGNALAFRQREMPRHSGRGSYSMVVVVNTVRQRIINFCQLCTK
jgi:hypothetical protein